MKPKIIASAVAAALLIAAGFATAIISAPSSAVAQEDDSEDQDVKPYGLRHGAGVLDEVLSDLVDEGVLDQDQADAVLDALETKATELKEEHEANRELLEELFSDGVLTSEEAEQLPDDHFLLSERFDEAWADGELTREEIGQMHPFRRGFREGFERGFHFSNDTSEDA